MSTVFSAENSLNLSFTEVIIFHKRHDEIHVLLSNFDNKDKM